MPTSGAYLRSSAGAEAVERADPDSRPRHERLDPLAHLAGGLVGERQGEDLFGRDSRSEQMGDPAGDDPRLARARSGQHQERALDVGHRLALRGRQVSEQVHQMVIPSAITRPSVPDAGAGVALHVGHAYSIAARHTASDATSLLAIFMAPRGDRDD